MSNAFDTSMLFLGLAMVATFLIGVNAALVYRFWPEPWFISKLVAVSGLLLYISLSLVYGNPSPWRAWIAAVAILIDFVALGQIWRVMNSAEKGSGILIAYRRR